MQNRLAVWRKTAEALTGGRTLEEQLTDVKNNGNHGAVTLLRSAVLAAHGVARPQQEAENCVIFGCYRPFSTPFLVRDIIRLLELLQIEYTYLDQEYCCGAALVMQTKGEQQAAMKTLAVELNRSNQEQARQKGAVRQLYCCVGCVHAAQEALGESSTTQTYVLDAILDRLEGQRLSLPPMTVGYFAGCRSFVGSVYPSAQINWSRYRTWLATVAGVTVIDLPKNLCCKTSSGDIVEQAEKLQVDCVVSACNWCYASLKQAAQDRVPVKSLPELLLQGLALTGAQDTLEYNAA